MDDGPYWVILLMYGSHDMRHTGFRRLTVVNGTPEFWGVTVRLYGVPISIVSDRDPRFTTHFWRSFLKAMGTQMTMSTTFHLQIDGQSERTIQVLEDMLRACVLYHKGCWEEYLPLVEFAYNNSYQASI